MNQLQRAVQRREAIRQAAIARVGWGTSPQGYSIDPHRHWEQRGCDTSERNKAAIEITTKIIEAYERVMDAPYIYGENHDHLGHPDPHPA